MTIRLVKPADIEPLTDLFEGYRKFYRKDPNRKTAQAFLSDRIINMDSKIYVCENAEAELVGFVQLYPIFSSTRMKKLWLLNDLFVHPDARGLGISKLLISRAKQLAKDTKAAGLMLETEISNQIGNRLYPATGFKLNEGSNFYDWENKLG